MVGQAALNREEQIEPFDAARTRMLAKMRASYLAGTLDDTLFPASDAALDRLMGDLFAIEPRSR